jgi:ADP-ribose pyrophosphatase YjhB (NUDIX family)
MKCPICPGETGAHLLGCPNADASHKFLQVSGGDAELVEPTVVEVSGGVRIVANLAVCAIFVNEHGELLVVSSRKYRGSWSLPGGECEMGETGWDALSRECREEVGVRVLEAAVVGEWDGDVDGWRVRVYHATAALGRPRFVEEGTHPAWAVGAGLLHADPVFGSFYRRHFPTGFSRFARTLFTEVQET